MGFCLFNNVAVAANYLLNDRVCIETFVLFLGGFISKGATNIYRFQQRSKVLYFVLMQ